MALLDSIVSSIPIPTVQTPFGTFGSGTVAQLISDISRRRVSAQQYVLLGALMFATTTYVEGMDRRVAADYAELAVLGGKPRLQCVGDRLDEFTWSIVLHAGFCTPGDELAMLEDVVRAHEALPMVFANGDYKGWFVPVEVAQTFRATTQDGTPIWVEAQLTLREYVEPVAVTEERRPDAVAAEKAGTDGKVQQPSRAQSRAAPERSADASLCRAGAQ